MTKQQQQLVEDNMNLVYFVINKYYPKLKRDQDMVQVGMLGLCQAASRYEEDKGAFTTFACKCIRSSICHELRARNKYNRADVISLNYEIDDGEGGKTELGDLIVGEPDVEYVEIDQLYNKLSNLDKQIVDLRKQGLTNLQIATTLGRSESRIHQRLRRLKRMYDQLYGGNDG